jgi:sn-glycerol 3-phosphate transport system ATP-binding protein
MGRAIVRSPRSSCSTSRCPTSTPSCALTSLFVTHDQVEAMTLAQRMMVMNAGVMEQFGTPEEVYHRPASTFVASFIGSPPMNLLSAAPGARAGSIMGIRPEHLDIGSTGWELKVETVELLGAERLVYCRMGDETLIVRTEEQHTAPASPTASSMWRRAKTACTGLTRPRANA